MYIYIYTIAEYLQRNIVYIYIYTNMYKFGPIPYQSM